MNPVQIPHDGGKKANVPGIPMVIRIHGSDTGGGPRPHIHRREDETFQVVDGLKFPPPPGV